MKQIRKLIHRLIHPHTHESPSYTAGHASVMAPGFRVNMRVNRSADRVQIGKESVMACSIVLERETGTVTIGDRTYIGASLLVCAEKIGIGSDVLIAWGCTIVDHDSHSLDWRNRADDVRLWREGFIQGGLDRAAAIKNWDVVKCSPVVIQDKVWIGFNSILLKGITVGEGAVIAAGSVVTKDVPAWTVVAGNPARVVKEIERVE